MAGRLHVILAAGGAFKFERNFYVANNFFIYF
jgi:hypothetical protein